MEQGLDSAIMLSFQKSSAYLKTLVPQLSTSVSEEELLHTQGLYQPSVRALLY